MIKPQWNRQGYCSQLAGRWNMLQGHKFICRGNNSMNKEIIKTYPLVWYWSNVCSEVTITLNLISTKCTSVHNSKARLSQLQPYKKTLRAKWEKLESFKMCASICVFLLQRKTWRLYYWIGGLLDPYSIKPPTLAMCCIGRHGHCLKSAWVKAVMKLLLINK